MSAQASRIGERVRAAELVATLCLATWRAISASTSAPHLRVAQMLADRVGSPPAVQPLLTYLFERWDLHMRKRA